MTIISLLVTLLLWLIIFGLISWAVDQMRIVPHMIVAVVKTILVLIFILCLLGLIGVIPPIAPVWHIGSP